MSLEVRPACGHYTCPLYKEAQKAYEAAVGDEESTDDPRLVCRIAGIWNKRQTGLQSASVVYTTKEGANAAIPLGTEYRKCELDDVKE